VVTNDRSLAERLRLLRSWGEAKRYEHTYRGFNYRMDGIQGAILQVKLRYLEEWIDARQRNAATYKSLLRESGVRLPGERSGVRHVYHLFVVRLQDRDAWRTKLTDAGVQTGVHYPIPVHLQPAYRDLGYSAGDFPVSEAAGREVLSLPMFPELTSDQIATVASSLRVASSIATP
jgi:dTDP-4-amino-4,6-dideoxygalactose transaminase